METRLAKTWFANFAKSSSAIVFDDISSHRIGFCAGFTFEYEGGDGMLAGSVPAAREIAAWTSCAAASTPRFSTN